MLGCRAGRVQGRRVRVPAGLLRGLLRDPARLHGHPGRGRQLLPRRRGRGQRRLLRCGAALASRWYITLQCGAWLLCDQSSGTLEDCFCSCQACSKRHQCEEGPGLAPSEPAWPTVCLAAAYRSPSSRPQHRRHTAAGLRRAPGAGRDAGPARRVLRERPAGRVRRLRRARAGGRRAGRLLPVGRPGRRRLLLRQVTTLVGAAAADPVQPGAAQSSTAMLLGHCQHWRVTSPTANLFG